jgi:cobalt/nickel transport protein
MKFRVRSLERGVKRSAFGFRLPPEASSLARQNRAERRLNLRKTYKILLLFTTFLFVVFILQSLAMGADKWAGVDESVVKKVAQEQGRKAWGPVINTDQGDLLLFVFLLAGAIGGFMAGYYWRILMVEKSNTRPREKTKS